MQTASFASPLVSPRTGGGALTLCGAGLSASSAARARSAGCFVALAFSVRLSHRRLSQTQVGARVARSGNAGGAHSSVAATNEAKAESASRVYLHGIQPDLGERLIAVTTTLSAARQLSLIVEPATVAANCSGCSRRGKAPCGPGRKGLRAGLLHDGGPMVVDRALADAEISGDILARMAGEHEVQDLAAVARSDWQRMSRLFPAIETASRCPRLIERPFDAGEQIVVADRLLYEIHGSRLHCLNGHWHGAISGDHDGCKSWPSAFRRSISSIPLMPGISASTSKHPSRPGR